MFWCLTVVVLCFYLTIEHLSIQLISVKNICLFDKISTNENTNLIQSFTIKNELLLKKIVFSFYVT